MPVLKTTIIWPAELVAAYKIMESSKSPLSQGEQRALQVIMDHCPRCNHKWPERYRHMYHYTCPHCGIYLGGEKGSPGYSYACGYDFV